MEDRVATLVVDAQENSRVVLTEVIEAEGFSVTAVATASEALRAIDERRYPVTVVDVEVGGFELVNRLQEADSATRVVVTSGRAVIETAVMALQQGASDFLFKPFEDPRLVARVVRRVAAKAAGAPEGAEPLEDLKAKNERLERANRLLRELSIRDGFTGLFSRFYFQETLAKELVRSERHGRPLAVLLVEAVGEARDPGRAGRALVVDMIGRRIGERVRRSDVPARFHGDTFAILLPETDREGARVVADSLATRLLGGHESEVEISIAVAVYPAHGAEGQTLIRNAEQALERSKREKGNRVCWAGQEGAGQEG